MAEVFEVQCRKTGMLNVSTQCSRKVLVKTKQKLSFSLASWRLGVESAF